MALGTFSLYLEMHMERFYVICGLLALAILIFVIGVLVGSGDVVL